MTSQTGPARRPPRRAIAASDRATGGSWTADEAVARSQPSRPIAIEVAAAVLIAAGVFRLLAIALAFGNPAPPFPIAPGIAAAETALQALTIAIGLLIRTGRAWIAAVNVIAVLAFIEILSLPSPVSLALAVLFGFAFAGTFLNKSWFDAMAAWRASAGADGRRRS